MLPVMIALALAGIALFLVAPVLAKLIVRSRRDPVALIRLIQLVGIILLLTALIIRPYNRETTAVPPPPDAPAGAR